MRIAFTTLGCKINQYESDQLSQDLLSKGNTIVPFDQEADVYVINTCSVTSKSDYQSRQIIRSAVKRGQGARIIVTGCYASTRPEEIKKIEGVDRIIHNRNKTEITSEIMTGSAVQAGKRSSTEIMQAAALPGRTRGYLKIQDGCNNRCTYCIVPLARGGSRSAEPQEVINQFRQLVEAGCPEIVLTGIHIGTYGAGLASKTNLTGLMETLISVRGQTRIRLSSIEPNEITDKMIGFLGRGLCRHLHIPLQSGDDLILQAMNRHYTAGFYRDLIDRIAQEVPGIALGADIMVGFPGEGEKEFRNTVNLVEESSLTHLHVFSYSPRPGTPAAEMKNQVPESVKKARSEELRQIGIKKNLEFRKKQVGTELKIVIEEKRVQGTDTLTGFTDNYIRAAVMGANKEHVGKELTIKIEDVTEKENFAITL